MIGHVIDFVDEIFIDLNRQVMEIKCTLNLGKLFKTTLDLNKHILQNLKLVKTHVFIMAIEKAHVEIVVSDLHMTLI
jgi:hypothetical protein